MGDVLEEQLAARLRELGAVTPVAVDPPEDLDTRVAHAKKAARGRRYGTALAVAAGFLVVVALATVLDGRTGNAPVAVAPAHDPLPAGTVMLGAKGRYVTARDATGKVLATMVTTTHGDVLDAQVTADHKTIFYRVTDPTSPCNKIARADIDGRTSSFVARGSSFAINPAGTSLAVSGYGEIGAGTCESAARGASPQLVVRDLEKGAVDVRASRFLSPMAWSDNGRSLVGLSCEGRANCGAMSVLGVDGTRENLSTAGTVTIAFGRDAMYRVDKRAWAEPDGPLDGPRELSVSIDDDDPKTPPTRVGTIPAGWDVSSIVPANEGLLMVATPPGASEPGIYRYVDGALELVRATNPGRLRPVFPLVAP